MTDTEVGWWAFFILGIAALLWIAVRNGVIFPVDAEPKARKKKR
jgi:hypothetical protein